MFPSLKYLCSILFVGSTLLLQFGRAEELRFGNTIQRVHPDEVELVKFLRRAGVGYNLNNQSSNPGGGGILDTDQGRVHTIYMSGTPLRVEQMKPFLAAKQLSRFDMPSWATNEHLAFFTEAGRFPNVTGLAISNAKITDEALAGLKNFPKLRTMNLSSTLIGDEGVRHIAQVPFTFLRLNSTQITDKGLEYLSDLPKLSFLELRQTRITDAGLRSLGGLKELGTLYLDGTAVTGSGFHFLSGLPKLKLLGLDKSAVNDAGLMVLGEYQNLRDLEVLYLAETKITDAGCQVFKNMHKLRVIALGKTNTGDAALRAIVEAPGLYSMTLGNHVTEQGEKYLSQNEGLSQQFRQQYGRKFAQRKVNKSMEKRIAEFEQQLTPMQRKVYLLGESRTNSKLLIEELIKHGLEAADAIFAMSKLATTKGHVLASKSGFSHHFRYTAGSVLSGLAMKNHSLMRTYAERAAESHLNRTMLRYGLEDAERKKKAMLPLDSWLSSEVWAVRNAAYQILLARAEVIRLGPGAASRTTVKQGSLELNEKELELILLQLNTEQGNSRHSVSEVVLGAKFDLQAKLKKLIEVGMGEKSVWAAIRILGDLGRQLPSEGAESTAVVDALMRIAKSSETIDGRRFAIGQLGTLGERAVDVLPQMVELLGTPELVEAVQAALKSLRSDPMVLMLENKIPSDVRKEIAALMTYDEAAVEAAVKKLAERGPKTLRALLVAARSDLNNYYPKHAVRVISHWEDEEVRKGLLQASDRDETFVRVLVIRAMAKLKWTKLPDIFAEGYNGVDHQVRQAILQSFDPMSKNCSGEALQELGAMILPAYLRATGYWERKPFQTALQNCFPECEDLLPKLLTELTTAQGDRATSMVNLLRAIATENPEATTEQKQQVLNALVKKLVDTPDTEIRSECAKCFGYFGVLARETIPLLEELIEEGEELEKSSAEYSLRRLHYAIDQERKAK